MSMRIIATLCLAGGLAAGTWAAEAETSIHEGSLENRVNALAAIQPGLGVVMHELGWRFANVYWAANGGNWRLAQYQLYELREASEVGEVTRPGRAGMLEAFERTHLLPLAGHLERKDLEAFNQTFTATVKACNACHTALGYGFIQYRVPPQPNQPVLDFTLKSEPEAKQEN